VSGLRSPFAPAALAALALVAAVARWWVQGSGNLYTALAKRFYVPDPDLGWRVSTQHPVWLGLELCAVLAAIIVALVIGGFLIRRRGRAMGLRVAAWAIAVTTLVVPIAAFASGPGPLHGRDTLPPAAAVLVEDGIEGSLDAPAGRYDVVAHPGTSITAKLSAGGEAFEARFDHGVTGSWQGDPHDLGKPMHAQVAAAAAAVDTGIGERTKHAREGYLEADKFPQITVAIDRVVAVRASKPGEIAFRAPATVGLMGKTHAVDVTGSLAKPDAQALARLGLAGDVLLVQADFTLAIHETALAPDAGDFDGDRLPIHVSLVLRKTP
jgi:polyisoprenoid-binding protein YceI